MPGNLDITGYAIVSDDDKIAAAHVPAHLSHYADPKGWKLHQHAQELANTVVFARRGRELEPNVHNTPRVLSFRARRDWSQARRLVVGPEAHDLGGSRGARAALGGPRRGGRRPGGVRSFPHDRL